MYENTRTADGDNRSESFSVPAAPTFKKEVSGIVASTGLESSGAGIRYKGKEVYHRITLVDADFFKMFTFPIVAGNSSAPLGSVNEIVISQTTAKAVFGNEDPVGKSVEIRTLAEWKAVTVSAVVADPPDNSTLKYNILARTEIRPDYPDRKNNWNSQDHPVYVQLAPTASVAAAESDFRALVKRHNLADSNYLRSRGNLKDEKGDYFSLRLESLAAVHFDEELGSACGRCSGRPFLRSPICCRGISWCWWLLPLRSRRRWPGIS